MKIKYYLKTLDDNNIETMYEITRQEAHPDNQKTLQASTILQNVVRARNGCKKDLVVKDNKIQYAETEP